MKRSAAVILALLLLASGVRASGTAGSQGDPVITLSYIDRVFLPDFQTQTDRRVFNNLNQVQKTQHAKLSAKDTELDQRIIREITDNRLVSAIQQKIAQKRTSRFTPRTVKSGWQITGRAGTGFVLRSGKATIIGTVVDVTDGTERKSGEAPLNHYLLTADGGAGLAVSADAVVDVDGTAAVRQTYSERYADLADALNAMGLFRGTGNGYELTRAANRCEALVMMLRLMGLEQDALSASARHPFTDVPAWASPYVAYAYEKGYTKGVTASAFGSEQSVSADQYMTFILRALAYRDDQGDFAWDGSVAFAQQTGMLTPGEQALLKQTFYRDQMAYVSYYALEAFVKDSGDTLLDTLIDRGVLSASTAIAAKARVVRVRP